MTNTDRWWPLVQFPHAADCRWSTGRGNSRHMPARRRGVHVGSTRGQTVSAAGQHDASWVQDRSHSHGSRTHTLPHHNRYDWLNDWQLTDSGRPQNKWWWCHDIGYPLLAPSIRCARPHGLELLAGRPLRAHSRTMSPLDSTWKLGFSLAPSVLSALKTATIVLYKFIFTIPYHTIRLLCHRQS